MPEANIANRVPVLRNTGLSDNTNPITDQRLLREAPVHCPSPPLLFGSWVCPAPLTRQYPSSAAYMSFSGDSQYVFSNPGAPARHLLPLLLSRQTRIRMTILPPSPTSASCATPRYFLLPLRHRSDPCQISAMRPLFRRLPSSPPAPAPRAPARRLLPLRYSPLAPISALPTRSRTSLARHRSTGYAAHELDRPEDTA